MFASVLRSLPLALITLAAFWLRTYELSRRPMHADEANQAVKTGNLLETGYYAFDPRDHHGPTLYYAALPIAWMRGEHSLATLTETTVRLVPAIAGTLSVVLLALLALPLGRWTACSAAAFLAVAPPAVYYSRYFIQETLLVTFTLGAFWCVQQWWRRGQLSWTLGAGACLGLMFATKATAPLFLLAAGLALLVARPTAPASPHILRAVFVAVFTALFVSALFFSSFGSHLAGLRDAFAVYGAAAHRVAGESGHEKPFWYYINLFGWHREGGLVWHQLAFSLGACAGVVVAVVRPQVYLKGAAAYTAVVLLVLSFTPYKTPWHAIHLVTGFSILAAAAVARLPRAWMKLGLFSVILFVQGRQTRLAAFLRPADTRNPYAYVHSSPDVLKFRALADAALTRAPSGVIRVIGEEYWPLPWYFRGLPRIGYWATAPEDCDGALVLVSENQADAVRAKLQGRYHETYLGVRPGVLFSVFTPVP